jgi:hypothetical protein
MPEWWNEHPDDHARHPCWGHTLCCARERPASALIPASLNVACNSPSRVACRARKAKMRPEPRTPLTTSLLRAYYSNVKDLRTYLTELLEPELSDDNNGAQHNFLPNVDDSPPYRALVDTTFVGSELPQTVPRRFRVFTPMMYMREASSPTV